MSTPRVVISGAGGLIGRALVRSLRGDDIPVVRLVRRPAPGQDEIEWLTGGSLSPDALAGATAVINLNGASIGRLPWGSRYRAELRRSRLEPTTVLAEALRALGSDAPPFVSASAVGFYGHRPGSILDESAGPGSTFLAGLCAEWEHAAQRAADVTRVAHLRTAPVLHPDAVLKPMIALTRLGLGGRLGSGRQVWPWISLEDEVRAIRHVMEHSLTGPVNLTGPTLATQDDIGRALAARLHRPYLLPAPAWALRIGLGEAAADSLLLADAAVTPAALTGSGFTFQHPTAADAIASALG